MLGTKGSKLLIETLQLVPTLKSLDLSYNNIGDSGALSLATLILKVPILELRVQGNKIASEGMIAIFESLSLLGKKNKFGPQ